MLSCRTPESSQLIGDQRMVFSAIRISDGQALCGVRFSGLIVDQHAASIAGQ